VGEVAIGGMGLVGDEGGEGKAGAEGGVGAVRRGLQGGSIYEWQRLLGDRK